MKKQIRSLRLLAWSLAALAGFSPALAQGQGAVITGRVTSDQGQPIIGAQVYINDLQISVGTNQSGNYSIVVPPARLTSQAVNLRVRAIGFTPDVKSIPLTAGAQTVNFALRQDINRLAEVVITGVTGATEQTKVPFAIARVSAEELDKAPSSNPLSALAGKVAGANIQAASGRPGAPPSVMLRAPTSISTNGVGASPVYIVDGVILSDQLQNTGGGGLASINVQDIENIEVVKGAAASSIYGARAARGVIAITTKSGKNQAEGIRFSSRTEYGTSEIENKFPISQSHGYILDPTGTRFCIDVTGQAYNACARSINYQAEVFRINNSGDLFALAPVGTFPHDPGSSFSKTSPGNPLQNSFQNERWPGTNYDAIEQFADPKPFWQQNLDMRGRAGNTSFYASANAYSEGGAIQYLDGFQRQSGRLNLDHSRGNWTFGLTSFYSKDRKDGFAAEDNAVNVGVRVNNSAFFRLTRQLPIANLDERDEKGRLFVRPNLGGGGSQNDNPMYRLENVRDFANTARFIGSANAQWRPVTWGDLTVNFSYDGADVAFQQFRDKNYRTTTGPASATHLGELVKRDESQHQLNTGANLVLRKTLFGDFNARTTLRYSYEDSDYGYRRGQGSTLAVVAVPNLNNVGADISITSVSQQVKSIGYLGGIDIDWKDRYIIGGLIRRDGSSLFGAANRWTTWARGSAAWRVSQEPWWFVPKINEFKLRASVGTAGNRPPFAAQYETYTLTSGVLGGAFTIGNKDLKPETVRETELGTDMEVFNRIGLGFTWSKTRAKDQILAVPLAAFSGASQQYQNAGELEGQTYEASINVPVFRRRDFSYAIRGTYDRSWATITKLLVPPYTFGSSAQGTDKLFFAREGEKYGTLYGRQFINSCSQLPSTLAAACGPGLDFQRNNEGFIVYVGAGNTPADGITKNLWQSQLLKNTPFYSTKPTGEGGRLHSSNDVYWGMPMVVRDSTGNAIPSPLGNALPKYRFGIAQNFTFKRLTAYALIDAAIGRSVYNQGRGWAHLDFLAGEIDQAGKNVEDAKPFGYYYRAANPDHSNGIGGFYDLLGPNSRHVEDASYRKLREASLAFHFGRVPGITGDWTAAIVGRNLKTWTKYTGFDPEVGFGAVSGQGGSGANSSGSGLINAVDAFQFPNPRTFTFSLSTSF
ncbi:MAG: SusC/RagA family TonB-linked outer membrane protein [Gemmatimonadota bacterium]|nr:SusC/RagA family TonB-linked outer membrane protein [Gemmatimonadota bacterium]